MLLNKLILILILVTVAFFIMPGSTTDVVPQLKNLKDIPGDKFSQFFSWGQDMFHKGIVSVKNAISWSTDRIKTTYKSVSSTVSTYWNETKAMLDKVLRIHEIIKE
ncbi:MAG: hypothetical protein WDZ40_01320 [Candidatus Spechtbacterales bacterium]